MVWQGLDPDQSWIFGRGDEHCLRIIILPEQDDHGPGSYSGLLGI